MKKLLVVLLSLGLIVAFSATASAVDVTFSGQYYVGGIYENNPRLTPADEAGYVNYSHAFFYQRLRFQPVFKIAEGLTFTARFDAIEKQWGNTNWATTTTDNMSSRRNQVLAVGTQSQKIQESIEFERTYVTFLTGIGAFQVGYQNVDAWGTNFGDFNNSRARIAYTTKAGPMTLALIYEKDYENDTNNTLIPAAQANATDADKDTYAISGTYNGKGIEAGMLYKYYAYNNAKPSGVKTQMNLLSPYVKATFGPVYIEGEAQYWFGKTAAYEAPAPAGTQDVDLQAYGAYLKGQMNAGPAYFGALFAYVSGNDLSDDTKNTANPGGGGTSFDPTLILNAEPLSTWTNTGSVAAVNASKYNMILYNAFVGFNPTPKWNVEAALTYATVDKKALSKTLGVVTEAVDDELGWEFDVKATYKIYDNLTYMIGAGYLWTGDYFKGSNSNNKIDDDYILKNQLTLSF